MFVAVACVSFLTSRAHDFEVGGIFYNVKDAETLTAEVTYGEIEYSGDVVIPSTVYYDGKTYSVTSIGNWAFNGCSGLTSITIGSGVTSIGNYAFYGCSGLTSVTIGSGVTSIGEWAFNGCRGLTSVTIPNSVTSIGGSAFSGCSGLTSVTIGSGVTSIGDDAFRSCSSLTSINVESGNTTYDSRENCNAIIETATNTLIAGCKNTVIPNSVTSIGVMAFYYCSGLTSITIPNSVISIGRYAFQQCSSLTSVTIGSGVTSIGIMAFYGCGSLVEIQSLADVPPTCGSSVFGGVDKSTCVLKVPAGSVEDYKVAEQWKDFENINGVDLVETLELDKTVITAKEGEQVTLVANILPLNATNKELKWSVDDENIVSIESNGNEAVVSILKEGTATITVETTDGTELVATCCVNALSGIGEILADDKEDAVYYTLNGIMVAKENLIPGLYIKKTATKTVKVVIK